MIKKRLGIMGSISQKFEKCIKNALLFMFFVVEACAFAGSFTDSRDGEFYTTVKIGRTEWMAENLRYNVRGSRCVNDIQKLCGFGRYYNFDMAEEACPSGWHLPTKKEWNDVFDKIDKSFGLVLLGYCFEEGRCFDADKTTVFWTSSDDNNSWTDGRRSDSFFKSLIPRRQKAFAVRFEAAQGIFINPPHSFLKDGYYFNVRCVID